MSLQINKLETKQDKNGFGYCVSMQTDQTFLNRLCKFLRSFVMKSFVMKFFEVNSKN